MAIAEVGGGALARGASELGDAAGPALADSAAAPARRLPEASVAGAWGRGALDDAAAVPEQARPYPPMPARTGYAPRALAFTAAERGYASPSATAKAASKTSATATAKKASSSRTTATKTSAKTTSKTTSKSTSAELAFLSDPRLSIEDKLFQFMALMQQKSDRELVDAMKQYEVKKAASAAKSGSTSKSSGGAGDEPKTSGGGGGGGLFGALGDALGGLAKTVVGGAESLAKDLGGPLLAAGCTAVGLPFLAPVALEVGGTLAKTAVSGLAAAAGLDALGSPAKSSGGSSRAAASGTSKASSSAAGASSKSAAADDGELDEKLEMMKLQRLVEKQSTMFAALSNVLKALHESQMSAVNNIR
ncbi:hypothetical protein [Anaeromyxobacter diazotrophicus]|uniref:Uncharacterized protein n=1 Tax=Anaeromyxobacter diazotrophicus TaxID=2590199 RepID=A0A7I9VNL7_9BACT|nr:hypothetical protein [Anaeromyxobacter diazotrophicus]GEJ58006.1 hypothetical protein AMYX_27470 [Anaeromyxobacter diazotrophicus]